MLKKRLIGIVTIKDDWAVQSFGYRRYLPLGKPECLVENLDRWGADEILVQVIDRSKHERGPDFGLLRKLAKLGMGTPLIYGGGIRSVSDGVQVVQSGADRIVVDALLHDDLDAVEGLSEQLGAQAVIASIPMALDKKEPKWLDYRSNTASPISESLNSLIENRVVSEVLLTDWKNEGNPDSFDKALVEQFPNRQIPLITFGGISKTEQMKELYSYSNVVAVSVGNFLNYRENAIQQLKDGLAISELRPSFYEEVHSLQADVRH